MGILDVEGLHIDFATEKGPLHAVRGVDFSLQEGEVLGIVGESGSGKSVTAHSTMRLLPSNTNYTGGDVRYRGQSVFALEREELRRLRGPEIAIIFQEPGRSFDPIYTIGKAMAETIRSHEPELSEAEIYEKSVRLLKETNVPFPEDRLSNYPHQFSGGLLQRIMIALALASDPKVLIADEPTTSLDVTIQAGIIDLLLRLKDERNLSIIFITHNLALISGIADRIVVMYAGLVMEQGSAEAVLTSPRHPYTRALLDSILDLGQHYTDTPIAAPSGTVPDPYRPEAGCPFAPRCPLAAPACREAVPPIAEDPAPPPGTAAARHRGGAEAPGGPAAGRDREAEPPIAEGPAAAPDGAARRHRGGAEAPEGPGGPAAGPDRGGGPGRGAPPGGAEHAAHVHRCRFPGVKE
ncbi:MAG: ABC transporter ATP-binding protein [Spirochaetia bacterium]